MFLLLTRILLWILIGFILWNVLVFLIPKSFLGSFGRILILIFLAWTFIDPTNPIVGIIGQILLFPLKPLGFALVSLIGAGAAWGYGKSAADAKKSIWAAENHLRAAFLVLLLSSVPIISYWLAQQSEIGAIQVEQTVQRVCQGQCPADFRPGTAQPPQAIVVIGQPARSSIPFLNQAQTADVSDRLIYAAQLAKDTGNPYIIVSTDARPVQAGTTAPAVAPPSSGASPAVTAPPTTTTAAASPTDETGIRTLLANLGVPGDRVFVEPSGPDLYSSSVAVKRRLDDLNLNRIVVVSSVLTSRRAALTFSQLGVQATPRFTDSYTRQPTAFPRVISTTDQGTCSNVTLEICNLRQLRFVDFIPSSEALALTTRVWEEFLLSVYYFLRGWLSPLGL